MCGYAVVVNEMVRNDHRRQEYIWRARLLGK